MPGLRTPFLLRRIASAWQIMRLLHTVVQSEGITALVATHDGALLELADSVLRLEDGQLAVPGQPFRPLSYCRMREHDR